MIEIRATHRQPQRCHLRLHGAVMLVYLITFPLLGYAQADAQARIDEAGMLVNQAEALGNLWRGGRSLMQQARQAHQNGRSAQAIELADKAAAEARLAINQVRLERARYQLRRYRELLGVAVLDAADYQAARQALVDLDGALALQLTQQLPLPAAYRELMP